LRSRRPLAPLIKIIATRKSLTCRPDMLGDPQLRSRLLFETISNGK
jgi:hypothetical protein